MSYYTHWHNVRYEIHKRNERVLLWFVWKLPREVVKWSAIRVMANATTGEYSNQIVPDLTAMDALQRWDK